MNVASVEGTICNGSIISNTKKCMSNNKYCLFSMQAMHLVYKALEKYAIPSVLPPELMPPGKRKDIITKAKSPTPMGIAIAASPQSQAPPIPPLPNTIAVKSLTGLDVVKVFIF